MLLDDPEVARSFPRGSIRLGLCAQCSLISNLAYDTSLTSYTDAYEDSQLYSARFRAFAEELVQTLAQRYPLRGRRVLEIGAGTGELLELLCAAADCTGTGVDPAARGRLSRHEGRVTLVAEPFAARHCSPVPALVLCRHTIEHLPHPSVLLADLAQGLEHAGATPVVFEVPDGLRILRECAFWDVYYEHVNYFTPGALAQLFVRAGFAVCDLALVFDDQYILLHARLAGCLEPALEHPLENLSDLREAAQAFSLAVARERARWGQTIRTAAETGRPVVLWGSGSKATGLLTALDIAGDVAVVVDVNPHKQGRFVAGTGHPIVSPEALVDLQPGLVIVMNPAYREEISADLLRLRVDAEVVTL